MFSEANEGKPNFMFITFSYFISFPPGIPMHSFDSKGVIGKFFGFYFSLLIDRET